MLVSIIFSFRNEEAVLDQLIDRVTGVLDAEPEEYELIFVNDDSSDSSLDILMRRRRENPRVKVINMSNRFGVSECSLAGMRHSTGDAVICMDADLQDPPEVIPEMLRQWRAGAEVVHTQRTRRLGENPMKMALTRLMYRLISMGSSTKFPIDAGDFKLLARPVVDKLVGLEETDPYLRGLIVWVGYKQVIVPYERQARGAGRTHMPWLAKGPWVHVVSGLTSFSFVPIYVVASAGVVGVIVALLIGLGALLSHPANPLDRLGLWLTFLIVFGWSTTQIGICGIGIYILRTYKDVRRRPLYIVKETIGL